MTPFAVLVVVIIRLVFTGRYAFLNFTDREIKEYWMRINQAETKYPKASHVIKSRDSIHFMPSSSKKKQHIISFYTVKDSINDAKSAINFQKHLIKNNTHLSIIHSAAQNQMKLSRHIKHYHDRYSDALLQLLSFWEFVFSRTIYARFRKIGVCIEYIILTLTQIQSTSIKRIAAKMQNETQLKRNRFRVEFCELLSIPFAERKHFYHYPYHRTDVGELVGVFYKYAMDFVYNLIRKDALALLKRLNLMFSTKNFLNLSKNLQSQERFDECLEYLAMDIPVLLQGEMNDDILETINDFIDCVLEMNAINNALNVRKYLIEWEGKGMLSEYRCIDIYCNLYHPQWHKIIAMDPFGSVKESVFKFRRFSVSSSNDAFSCESIPFNNSYTGMLKYDLSQFDSLANQYFVVQLAKVCVTVAVLLTLLVVLLFLIRIKTNA